MQIRFSGPAGPHARPGTTKPPGVSPNIPDRVTFSGKGQQQALTADELLENGKNLALGRHGVRKDPGLAKKYFEAACIYPNQKALDVARFYLDEFKPSSLSMAVVFLEKAVDQPTFNQQTRFEVADIYIQRKMNDRAAVVLKRIAEDDPAFAFDAGRIFAEKLGDPENAVRCLEIAAKKSPADVFRVYQALQTGLGSLQPDPALAAELARRHPKLDY